MTELTSEEIVETIENDSDDYEIVDNQWPDWVEIQHKEAVDLEDDPLVLTITPHNTDEILITTKYKIKNKRHSDYYNDEHTCTIDDLIDSLDDYINNLVETFQLVTEDAEPDYFYDESEDNDY